PPRRPPNRSLVWPGGRHPDRYTGLVRGRRTKGDLLEPVVLALEREGLTGPQPGQDPETLVEHLTSHPQVLLASEPRELRVGRPTEPHSQDEPSSADEVERGGLSSQLPGMPPGQGCDHGHQPDAFGHDGGSSEQDPQVGDLQIVTAEDVIPDR